MADLTDEYWADDRAAFEAAMAEGGEDLNCAKWNLPGIEQAYKSDRTRLMYFAWGSGREHERAANTKPASEPVQDAASIEGLMKLVSLYGRYKSELCHSAAVETCKDIRDYAQRLKEGK